MSDVDALMLETERRFKAIEERQKRSVTTKQFLIGTIVFVVSISLFQMLIS